MAITSEQVRAARALLRWEQRDLAEAARISLPSVKRLEGQEGALSPALKSVVAVKGALENKGIHFTCDTNYFTVALDREKYLLTNVYSSRAELFPDVAEWSEPISGTLDRPDLVGFDGDRKPVIVEVKSSLEDHAKLNNALEQLENYALQYGSRTAILVARSLPDTLPKMAHLNLLRRETRSLHSSTFQLLVFSLR
ncbi:hypothetical protein ACRAWG_34835 [Methylobacterium sp. P31]